MDNVQRLAEGTAERAPRRVNGMAVMVGDIILMLASAFGFISGLISIIRSGPSAPLIALMTAAGLWFFILGPILFLGLKIVKPNEAMVLTLFGRYHGCLRQAGFWFVNPFSQPMLPSSADAQKAAAAAKQKIVEGAVGMVEMALEKLNAKKIVHLDEERTAAMVSNLLVVLCANKDTQPVVNSGSIY